MTLSDVIPDLEAAPEQQVATASMRDTLDAVAMSALSDQERMIIYLRFGLFGGAARNLAEVGLEFDLTCERIRQIESGALLKLQQPWRQRQLEDYR